MGERYSTQLRRLMKSAPYAEQLLSGIYQIRNLILLFVVFILVYTLTTRILESFEYESKMETLGKVSKALIDKGVLIDYKGFTELLDLEKEKEKENKK